MKIPNTFLNRRQLSTQWHWQHNLRDLISIACISPHPFQTKIPTQLMKPHNGYSLRTGLSKFSRTNQPLQMRFNIPTAYSLNNKASSTEHPHFRKIVNSNESHTKPNRIIRNQPKKARKSLITATQVRPQMRNP